MDINKSFGREMTPKEIAESRKMAIAASLKRWIGLCDKLHNKLLDALMDKGFEGKLNEDGRNEVCELLVRVVTFKDIIANVNLTESYERAGHTFFIPMEIARAMHPHLIPLQDAFLKYGAYKEFDITPPGNCFEEPTTEELSHGYTQGTEPRK